MRNSCRALFSVPSLLERGRAVNGYFQETLHTDNGSSSPSDNSEDSLLHLRSHVGCPLLPLLLCRPTPPRLHIQPTLLKSLCTFCHGFSLWPERAALSAASPCHCALFHTIYGCAEQSSCLWGSRLSPCSVKRDQSLLPRLRAFNWLLIQGLSVAARFPQRVSEKAFSKSFLADPGLLQTALPLNTDRPCHTISHSLPSPLQLDTIHLLQAAQSHTRSPGRTPTAISCSLCCCPFTSSHFPGL